MIFAKSKCNLHSYIEQVRTDCHNLFCPALLSVPQSKEGFCHPGDISWISHAFYEFHLDSDLKLDLNLNG